MLDKDHGKLYATHLTDTTVAPSFAAADPTGPKGTPVGSEADVAVGVDGTVVAASLSGGVTTLVPAGQSFTNHHDNLPGNPTGSVNVTSVGSRYVVLIGAQASPNPLLVVQGRAAAIPIADAQGALLQQPGPQNDVVYLETTSRLISVNLATGQVTSLKSDTSPQVPQANSIAGAPVFFRGCVFSAWADGTSAYNNRLCGTTWTSKTIAPANPPESVDSIIYRVNHDEILLNDPLSGAIFLADGVAQQIDSWDKVHQPETSQKPNDNNPSTGDSKKPPTANNDALGARAGTSDGPHMTTLHVLDNDGVGGGSVLTVDSVTQPSTASAHASISADRLSVLLSVDKNAPGSFTFTYVNSNGISKSAKPATVTITIAPDGTYAPPTTREVPTGTPLPITQPWSVPINGTISIPVLNDWRNKVTGDPVALSPLGAEPELKGRAITTTDGTIEYKAPNDPGTDVVNYITTDGPQPSTPQKITIKVIDGKQHGVPPVANSDYTHGTAGSTFTFNPLLNDIPGADPLSAQNALLAIQGKVASKKGLDVVNQGADGTLTLRGATAGPYTLTYSDTYGTLVSKPATIRVDIIDEKSGGPIVAGLDSATVHGTTPALVDVLGNDFDPNGQMLTVVGWSAPNKSNLTAAVVDGRWLRVNETNSVTSSTIETLMYRVSDGIGSRMATGQIVVTELPHLVEAAPLPADDYAIVRQGDAVTVPVLDNDLIEDGSSLTLQQDFRQAKGAAPLAHGQLPVSFVGNVQGDPGQAFVSGNVVRYVAPPRSSTATTAQQVTVQYRVVTDSGVTADSYIHITITPPGKKITDGAPVPQDLQARVVSGGATVIHVPTSGVDPDGDTVQVVGLALDDNNASGPRLGSITKISADSFTYQAFPSADNGGTDTFKYTVADTYGVQATATISVSVVPPTALPAPVPHPISVTTAPGTTIRVKVVSPTHIDYPEGDAPTLIDPKTYETNGGASLVHDDSTSLLIPVAANSPKSFVVPYQVRSESGSLFPSGITVSVVDGYVAPPIAIDQFAHISGTSPQVVVNLLAGDFSQVVGPAPTILPPAVGQLVGTSLHVTITNVPQVIPYVIKDSAGGEAAAIVYVPAGGATGLPFWNGTTLHLDKLGQPVPYDVNKYVKDPAGLPVRLLTDHDVWPAPTELLHANVTGTSQLTLRSDKDSSGKLYQGPAAITFSVVTGRDINATTFITIPVIIGNPAPVLRCPTDSVPVTQNDINTIDIATECHVWTQDNDSSKLMFHLAFKKPISGVKVSTNDVHQPVIEAGLNAPKNAPGTLTVTLAGGGGVSSDLSVVVVPARALTIATIPVQTVTASVGQNVDLLPYVDSPFKAKHSLHFVGTPSTHQSVSVKPSGELGLQVVAASKKDLAATISFTVGDNNDPSRNRTGTVLLQVLDVPSAPVNVVPRPDFLDKTILLDWVASQPRGAQVTDYVIQYEGPSGGWSQDVHAGPATSFAVKVPGNAVPYSFRVKGCNGVKTTPDACGDWSVTSPSKRADIAPGPVTHLTATASARCWFSRHDGLADSVVDTTRGRQFDLSIRLHDHLAGRRSTRHIAGQEDEYGDTDWLAE